MALNFPASPSNGQEYVAPNGVTYIYDAAAGLWYVKTSDAIGTSDINDGAITTAKLADDAVTGGKLANDITISTTGDITANSLTLPTAPVVGYQQGTWTPDASVTGSVATVATGYYSRVGNQVTVHWRLEFSTLGGNGSSLSIFGLPYVSGLAIHAPGVIRESSNSGAIYACQINAASDAVVMNSYEGGVGGSARTIRTGEQYDGCITYTTNDTTWTPINGATVS